MASALRLGLPRPAVAAAAAAAAAATTRHMPSVAVPAIRSFSTTLTLFAPGLPRQGTPKDGLGQRTPIPKPHARDPHIPAYPYGPRRVYKQSNSGLYGSARIQFGNNVSPKHGVKTPRKWRPNVQRRRLWSMGLNCFVQTRITLRVMRTVDKVGGLDNYLLGDKAQRIKDLGPWGWKLRWRLMQSPAIKERLDMERRAMGLNWAGLKLNRKKPLRVRSTPMASSSAPSPPPARGEIKLLEQTRVLEQTKLLAETDRMLLEGQEFDLTHQGHDAKDEGFK